MILSPSEHSNTCTPRRRGKWFPSKPIIHRTNQPYSSSSSSTTGTSLYDDHEALAAGLSYANDEDEELAVPSSSQNSKHSIEEVIPPTLTPPAPPYPRAFGPTFVYDTVRPSASFGDVEEGGGGESPEATAGSGKTK